VWQVPIIDSIQILDQPYALWTNYQHANVPLIFGSVEYEGNWMALYVCQNFVVNQSCVNVLSFESGAFLPNVSDVQTVMNLYNFGDYVNSTNPIALFEAIGRYLGDFVVDCGTFFATDVLAKNSSNEFWRYYFIHNTIKWDFNFLNATHLVDIAYVFNTSVFGENFTTAEISLAEDVVTYWNNLHLYGNPNGPNIEKSGLTYWPAYSSDNESVIVFQTGGNYSLISQPEHSTCKIWDDIFNSAWN